MNMAAVQEDFSYQQQLKYLLDLSEQLAQVHEMDELLTRIIALAVEVAGAENGALFLRKDDTSSVAEMEARVCIINGEPGTIDTLKFANSAVEKTARDGKGLLLAEGDGDFGSIMCVPLITSGTIHGLVYLDNSKGNEKFTDDKFELLKAFAIEAAISIENARLYERVQETARVEQEMEIATDIQTSILPFVENTDHYEISAFMRTATEVGGDYYDFFLQEEPFYGVFGDVSGHGLKSGLVMMMAEVAFNTMMKDPDMKSRDLPELYQTINVALHKNIQSRLSKASKIGSEYSHMYMTFRLFRFDADGNFEMFGNDNAEPFVCKAKTGEVNAIESSGFLLGIMEDAIQGNSSTKFRLNSGDLLVLYSDGISEAKKAEKKGKPSKNAERDMFGEEKLHKIVAENRTRTPQKIIEAVIRGVDS